MMNRRAFLAWLGGTAAGVALTPTLDLDKLLWIPGEKTIFVPPPPVLATSQMMTRGDVFTIDGVYAVNPLTGKPLTILQHFVVTADVAPGTVAMAHVYPRVDIDLGPRYPQPRIPRGSKAKPVLVGHTLGDMRLTFTDRS